jgi:hypothetical protein
VLLFLRFMSPWRDDLAATPASVAAVSDRRTSIRDRHYSAVTRPAVQGPRLVPAPPKAGDLTPRVHVPIGKTVIEYLARYPREV